MLKQPSSPRRVQTLNDTFTALVQACLRHQKTIRKHAKELRVTRHPESDAGCFWVGQGLRVEATAHNVDNDGKRPGPEYAGKTLSRHACCWLHPGKNIKTGNGLAESRCFAANTLATEGAHAASQPMP
jgi:hypothetical protein